MSLVMEDETQSEPRARVFLPAAPSFMRKLSHPDEVSSVESSDERRYSDVPSMGALPCPRQQCPKLQYMSNELPVFPSQAPKKPQPVRLVFDSQERTKSGRLSWRRLFSSRLERRQGKRKAKAAGKGPLGDDPPLEAVDRNILESAIDDDLPYAKPQTPRRHRRPIVDPVRWAAMACLPRPRTSRASESRKHRVPLNYDEVIPDNHHEVYTCAEHTSGLSFSRLPKSKTCGACGVTDPLNEPNSFAGFRSRPWYLYPEGSSISSSDWDTACNTPSSNGSEVTRSSKGRF